MTATPFRLSPVVPGGLRDVQSGTFIVLLDALRIPPHLLLCHRGALYSLSAGGRQSGSPLEKLLGFIQRKKTPALFVEWKLPASQEEQFADALPAAFARYPRAEAGKVSCLSPIRDLAATLHGESFRETNFIFELLPALESKGLLGRAFAFNLEAEDHSFTLLTYSENAVDEAIRSAVVS